MEKFLPYFCVETSYLLRGEHHLGRELAGEVLFRVGGRDAHESLGIGLPGEALDGQGQPQLLELFRVVRLQLVDLQQHLLGREREGERERERERDAGSACCKHEVSECQQRTGAASSNSNRSSKAAAELTGTKMGSLLLVQQQHQLFRSCTQLAE